MDTILTLTCPHRHTSQPKPREGIPFRRESPERAEPSLGGGLGVPPTPIRSASRPAGESGEGGALFGGGLGVPPNPYSLRFPSGGRVQRGRRPLWWRLGEPPNPFRSASRQGSGRTSGAGMAATITPLYTAPIPYRDVRPLNINGRSCSADRRHRTLIP